MLQTVDEKLITTPLGTVRRGDWWARGKKLMALIMEMLGLVQTTRLPATAAQQALGTTGWFNSHPARSMVSMGTLLNLAEGQADATNNISHTSIRLKKVRCKAGTSSRNQIPPEDPALPQEPRQVTALHRLGSSIPHEVWVCGRT